MDDFNKMINELNKDLAERRKLFDAIEPFYIDLILLGFGQEFSDDVFLRAAGIKRI